MLKFSHMPPIRTLAIVLHSAPFAEADRRVTLLTRDAGKRVVIAKSASKPTSKFVARTLPLSHIEVFFAPGRSLDILSECESIDLFADLRNKPKGMSWGLRMAEFVHRALPVGGRVDEFYSLFLSFLEAIRKASDPAVPAAVFMVKFLALEGVLPSFDRCAMCKRKMHSPPRKVSFGNSARGILCRKCAAEQMDTTIVPYLCIQDVARWEREDWKSLTHTSPAGEIATLIPILEHYAAVALG